MSAESILLANLRIAPIQVTSYGHSVSTFGADVDYWIGSADVELESDLEQNYSERPLLLPGLGIGNVRPSYSPRRIPKRRDRLVINCAAHRQKVTHPFLCILRRILDKSPKNVLLRLFTCGGQNDSQNFLPFVQSVTQTLEPGSVQFVPDLSYADYMATMEEGVLALDSYHYGGCNSVVDSLHLRIPVVTLSGTRWNNRIGGGLLRQVGLPELVAESVDEYVDLSVRLINDRPWRKALTERLRQLDLDRLLYHRPQDGQDFKRAIDFLVQNHARLQAEGSRRPLYLDEVASV